MNLLTALRCPRAVASPIRAATRLSQRSLYSTASSDDVTPPPILQKLKGELKAAMRAKDQARLSVLRAIMSANLNASKTSSPILTDVQAVALIRKLQNSSKDAVEESKLAGRQDLVDKESEQVRIFEEYIAGSGVQSVSAEEMKGLIAGAVEASRGEAGKATVGDVMKRLSAAIEGKDVDKKSLASLIKEAISQ